MIAWYRSLVTVGNWPRAAVDDTVVVCNLIFATPKQALILTMFWTALLSSARTIVQVCNIFDFNGLDAEVHGFRMSIRSRLVVDN